MYPKGGHDRFLSEKYPDEWGGMRYYSEGGNNRGARGSNGNGTGGSMYFHELPYDRMSGGYDRADMMDPRMGRSHKLRKTYMEGKESHHDKTKQMQELEQYMQELSSDVTEMIQDASPEEKALLTQKLNTLVSKIK